MPCVVVLGRLGLWVSAVRGNVKFGPKLGRFFQGSSLALMVADQVDSAHTTQSSHKLGRKKVLCKGDNPADCQQGGNNQLTVSWGEKK